MFASIASWWDALSTLQQVFMAIAIPATVIMVLQSILLLFGFGHGDADGDVSADAPDGGFDGADGGHFDAGAHIDAHDGTEGSDGVSLFTIRGIVAFFAVGGWMGVVMDQVGAIPLVSVIVAFVAGFLALLGIAWLFKIAVRLQASGNLRLENAIGKTGRVYLTIPGAGKGVGKVNVTVQEVYSELEAMTRGAETLRPGRMVRVTGMEGSDLLVVEPVEPVETSDGTAQEDA